MTFSAENILLLGSILIFSAIIISKTGYKLGVPSLLVFLVVGMLFGSDGLGLHFENAKQAQFIGMVSLSVILFTGGMDTKMKEIKPVLLPGLLLSTLGVLVTTALTGLFIYYISHETGFDINLSLIVSMLLAATMSSTDSASVFNILRTQKINLKQNLRPLLELESGSNDPMAYMLTIVLISLATSTGASVGQIAADFAIQFVVGSLAGFFMGKLGVLIINKIRLNNSSLYPILLLSIVFFTFTITDMLKGNGYLAVYISGAVVGNAKIASRRETQTFFDGFTWLSQIIMFLALGLLVNPHELLGVAPVAVLIGLFMMLVARPASVFLCLLPFKSLGLKAKTFTSWVGLRGAVPIIFATYPVVADIDGADQIFNIVFFITLLSMIIQGSTISLTAKKLNLYLPLQKEGNDFGIEFPDEIDTTLKDIEVTEKMLENGNKIADMKIPKGTLVMIVKRGKKHIIPNGSLRLQEGDKLLLISENEPEK